MKIRNPVARELRAPKFRPRVVASRKRKPRRESGRGRNSWEKEQP
jgi:hypothetical protein